MNGDGKLGFEDKQALGNTIPKLTFGASPSFKFKRFDLNILLQGILGVNLYTQNSFTNLSFENRVIATQWRDAWTPDNTDTDIPALRFNNTWNSSESSFWVKKGDFVKLKNIQLGYAVPENISTKYGMKRAYFYLNAQNVFTLVNGAYQGYDPEKNTFSSSTNLYPCRESFHLVLTLPSKIMKIKYIFLFSLLFCSGCTEQYLDVFPEDKITTANFPQDEADVKLALNGVYALLRENSIYNQGLFGFGVMDGATPNGFNWGNTPIDKLGNGQLSSQDGDLITFRWTRCYAIIFRANYLMGALEEVPLKDDVKATYKGEAHFLRGLAYSVLADSYGGVPLIKGALTAEEARNISRASLDETWNQVIADYDVAIQNLGSRLPK